MKRTLTKFIILIAAAVAIYFATVFYLDWRIPRATATLQLHPEMFAINANSSGINRHYIVSEFRTIPTQETKNLATTFLGIEENQQAETNKLMDENVTIIPIEGTDFITITAKYPAPQQAINTANAIAEAYVQRRNESEVSHAEHQIEALDEEILSQQKRVTDNQADFQALINEYGHPPFSGDDPVDLSLKQRTYTQAEETYEKASDLLRRMRSAQRKIRILLKQPIIAITLHERATLTPSRP